MAFVAEDIIAALGAGFPQQVWQLDGTLDLSDPSTLYGVGAVGGGVAPTVLTVVFVADDKVYDDSTAATGSLALVGVIGDDDVSVSATSVTFASANVGTGIVVTASGLSLSGADAGSYSLASTSATDTADITARALTIRASNKSKPEGDPDPALTIVLVSGVIQGNDTSSGSLTRDAGEAVGSYAITQGTFTYGSNYNETFIEGLLTIYTPSTGNARKRRRRFFGITRR